MGDIIKSLKEFIWDITGYLIPGFLFVLVMNFVIDPKVAVPNSFLFDWSKFNESYIIIVVSYASGYIIYGLTLLKMNVQDQIINTFKTWKIYSFLKRFHSREWEEDFQQSAALAAAKDKLTADGYTNVSQMKLNELRNILMSRDPKMDQKVYTFMFRASVFDHVSTIFLFTILLAIIQCFLSAFKVSFLKMDVQFIIMYCSFFLLSSLLGAGKRKFYSIAQRIPFSNLK
ncbi:MAG TPA: hypothetical protein VGD22_11265 [Sphingobacteriaceae bacterium]